MWPENSVVFINSAWPAKTVSAGLLCLYGLQTERQTWRSPVPLLIRCLIFPPDVGNEIVCNKVWRVISTARGIPHPFPLSVFSPVCSYLEKKREVSWAGRLGISQFSRLSWTAYLNEDPLPTCNSVRFPPFREGNQTPLAATQFHTSATHISIFHNTPNYVLITCLPFLILLHTTLFLSVPNVRLFIIPAPFLPFALFLAVDALPSKITSPCCTDSTGNKDERKESLKQPSSKTCSSHLNILLLY